MAQTLATRVQAFRNWWNLAGFSPLSVSEIEAVRIMHANTRDFRPIVSAILSARAD